MGGEIKGNYNLGPWDLCGKCVSHPRLTHGSQLCHACFKHILILLSELAPVWEVYV